MKPAALGVDDLTEWRATQTRRRLAWLVVVPVLLLALWLGARGLTADALWYDEERSIFDAGGANYGPLTPVEIWQRIATRNRWHTPGYFILLSQWGTLVGWSPFAGRTLSLLLGLLAVAWTYRAGRDLFGPSIGVNAALLLGASAFFVYYLHELRLYTLYALLVSLAIWLYWRVVYLRAGWLTQIAFSLAIVGLLYTHYFASLTVVGIGLYHLLLAPKRPAGRWWRVVILMGIAGAAFLPWFRYVWELLSEVAGGGSNNSMLLPNNEIVTMSLYALANGALALWLVPVGLAALHLRDQAALRLLGVTALAVLLLSLLVNAITAVIPNIRYLMALFPLMALFAAVGVDVLARFRPAREVLLAAWIVLGVMNSLNPAFHDTLYGQRHLDFFRPHLRWDELADTIDEHGQTGDAVAFSAPIHAWTVGSVFTYYMDWLPVRYTMLDWLPGDVANDEYYGQAHRFIAERQRVWLAEEHNGPPDPRLAEFERALADDGFAVCPVGYDDTDMRVQLYAREPMCCAPPPAEHTPLIQFGDGVRLAALSRLPETVASAVDVTLAWQQNATIPRGVYSVALHLLNTDGELVAQADAGLPPDDFACQAQTITLPGDLPPGSYTLTAILYNWSSGERLQGTAADGTQGERLPLTTVTVSDQ